jgi:hypothetical protein
MQPKTRRAAELEIAKQEQRVRLLERAARKNAPSPAMVANALDAATRSRAKATRLRALLPTLPEAI